MINRYPDKAKIVLKAVTVTTEGGLRGNNKVETSKVEITGRFSLEMSAAVKYSARFYTGKLNVKPFDKDGAMLEFEGRTFKIMKFSQRQMHTVLWLE